MKRAATRILGPYAEKDGHRLIVVENGQRKALKFSTAEKAQQIKQQLLGAIEKSAGCTIFDALVEYEEVLISERGRPAYTVRDERARLGAMLPLDEPIRALTIERATELYRKTTQRLGRNGRPLSADSLYFLLKTAKRFATWCVERGHLTTNPFAKIRRVGRASTGKTQLTADEARRFLDTALRLAATDDRGAVAVALQLSLGLRSSEVLSRCVRDLDEGGSILLIGHGKTKNARRRLELPDFLQPHLRRLAASRCGDELLFGADRHGKQLSTCFLIRQVHRVCALAAVPKVCAHSLRGLHATLALRQGASTQAVAAALGHGSFVVTARHYAEPTQLMNTRIRTLVTALRAPNDDAVSELAATLRTGLSAAQVKALIEQLSVSDE